MIAIALYKPQSLFMLCPHFTYSRTLSIDYQSIVVVSSQWQNWRMRESVPPGALFVAADEPLLVFPSVAAAESYLEAIDVRNGVYPAAYGPKGEPYRIDSYGDHFVITQTGEPNRPDELSGLLSRYLEATGRSAVATATFEELVATVWAIEGDFRREYDPYGERFGTRTPLWGCVGSAALAAALVYFVFR